MAGKIPRKFKMKDIYDYCRANGMLTTQDGYVLSQDEFSKIIHHYYYNGMKFSIENNEPVRLFAKNFCLPVKTLCTHYLPIGIDMSKYDYRFTFLFLSCSKKFRNFRFKTAPKIKKLIMEQVKLGTEYLDITMDGTQEYAPQQK